MNTPGDILYKLSTYVDKYDVAEDILHFLVYQNVVVSGHITSVHSLYRWNGKVLEGTEYCLDVLCLPEHAAVVETLIREQHNYEMPAVLIQPMCADGEIIQWLSQAQSDRE